MTIAHYTIARRAVESDILLPELESRSCRGADPLQIRLGRVRPAARTVVAQDHLPDGRLWRVLFGTAEGYLFHFPELAVFATSRDGGKVDLFPDPEVPPETLRHLLLDQVLPYLTPTWGVGDVFHASGIATPSGAIGFLGATGRGKSTLAAAFARREFAVLGDDCFCVDEGPGGFRVTPWYPGLRLWPENPEADGDSAPVAHYTRKRRFRTFGDGIADAPVRAMFLLEPPASDGGVRIQKISPRDAALELTRHAFFLDPEDRTGVQRLFDRVCRLSEGVPLFSLSYPRSFEILDQVVDEIQAHAGMGMLECFDSREGP